METETKLRASSARNTDDEGTWLAIQGPLVAGSFMADCYVCAERQRDQDFPGCQLALLIQPGYDFPMCRREFAQLPLTERRRLIRQWELES